MTIPKYICQVMTRIYELGLTTPSGGNISVKDAEGNIWITPSGGDKSCYREKDILKILPDGTVTGDRKPSIETEMHLAVYRQRPELKALIHAHPAALVAASFRKELPQLSLLPAVGARVGRLGLAAYGCPGTADLAVRTAAAFERQPSEALSQTAEVRNQTADLHNQLQAPTAALLENHGVLVGSETGLADALELFQQLNFLVEVQAAARKTGHQLRTIQHQHAEMTETGTEIGELSTGIGSAKDGQLIKQLQNFYSRALFRHIALPGLSLVTVRGEDGSILYGYDELADKQRVDGGILRIIKTIYQEHPEISAVIYAHPSKAMAFAVTDAEFDLRTIPECYMVLKSEVEKFPYGFISQNEGNLQKLADHLCSKSPVAILENQGYIAVGSSLLQAYDRLEVLENAAAAMLTAKDLGGDINLLTKEQVEEIRRIYG